MSDTGRQDTARYIRESFLQFYRERNHRVMKGAPLVPKDDPTLLFTSAGMVQFKKNYSTREPLEHRRVATIQKCLRATDIESVGFTPRHLTFFEMLGHFSFGDYFKREAIRWNWELMTEVWKLPVEKLKVSVYLEDDEAYEIWNKEIGLDPSRIYRLGKEDNFWGPAGETGACGPSTEVYYDLGEDLDPDPTSGPGSPTDRWIEIGNFVFPQYDMQPDKSMPPLANRGIDTGIGLDRVTLVMEGKRSIFETTLFTPYIRRLEEISGRRYEEPLKSSFHVIADHIRTLTFALAERILPSNEGRGYVIRRLLRRAAVQGHRLGLERPFLKDLCEEVVRVMGDSYHEIQDALPSVKLALEMEEDRFQATLSQGLLRFEDAAERLKKEGSTFLPGEVVFQLYDTYGFPVDLTHVLSRERGLEVDEAGFTRTMQEQRERSRAKGRFQQAKGEDLEWTVLSDGAHSVFRGYETTELPAEIRRYAALPGGKEYLVVLDETPFYAESGGQVGDVGSLESPGFRARVLDTLKKEGEIRHRVELLEGSFPEANANQNAARVDARVENRMRADTKRNHTATHLLHAALRQVLGPHVTQAGSLVAPDRLRFDFTHSQAMTHEELSRVEDLVNDRVFADEPVTTQESSYDEAIQSGVMALFGEKYGDRVRRIEVGEFSRELCGGTHVSRTGEIGAFLVTSETGIAAGTRRIEAQTGFGALKESRRWRESVDGVRRVVQATAEELPQKVLGLQDELARLRKQIKDLKARGGDDPLAALSIEPMAKGGLLVSTLEVEEGTDLRAFGDRVRTRLGRGAGLLAIRSGGKSTLLAVVTDDLIAEGKLRADEVIKTAVEAVGGRGGGKPHLAMAGIADEARVDEALKAGADKLRGALSS